MLSRNRRLARWVRGRAIRKGEGCAVCGIKTGIILHAHHLIPLARGGADEEANLVVLCFNCHWLAHYIRARCYQRDRLYKADAAHLNESQKDKLFDLARHGLEPFVPYVMTPEEEKEFEKLSAFDDWVPPPEEFAFEEPSPA